MSDAMEFIESSRGVPVLLLGGYKYNIKKINKNTTTRWICVSRTCGGSITTNSSKEVVNKKIHSCVVDEAKNEVDKVLHRCKKRAREEVTPIPQLFYQEMSNVRDAGLEFVTKVPNLDSKKSSLYRQRHRELGVTSFSNRGDIILPASLKESFLFFDDGSEERIMGFASESARELLSEKDDFFADGTFKSCSKQFDQLYTIHTDIGSSEQSTNIVPVVYALLPNRKANTYSRLFGLIKEQIPLWKPKTFKIDFETSAIQSFRNTFPSAKLTGCNFHFNQCLWRKIQELGMVKMFKDDDEIREHVKMCAALAHIPTEFSDSGWLQIMENSPLNSKVEQFNDYFVEQWLENDIVKDMWVCYGERHRTTNSLEGWHSRLNRAVGKHHPNIFELVKILRTDARHYDMLKIQHDLFMTANKRAKKYINLDRRIAMVVEEFVTGRRTLGRCLKNLSYIIQF